MQDGDVGMLLREAVIVTLKLGGPPMLAGLVVGVVISLFQAVTQIHEQALGFVPKVVVVSVTLLLLGPSMLTTLQDYTRMVFDRVVAVGGG
jgi:flagellar biosynthetic protein FliQ